MAADQPIWPAPVADGPVDAEVSVPGSKSATNRALLLAALAPGQSRLQRPLRARDTLLMAGALEALGVPVAEDGDQPDADWLVDGPPEPSELDAVTVDCGNAGTVARFLPAAAAVLARGRVDVDGDPRMRERPLGPLLAALRALGAEIDDGGRGAVPFRLTARGQLAGGEVSVDATRSSQLVSGLLLAAPRFDNGIVVRHVGGRLPSTPHLQMTTSMLREAGATVHDDVPNCWRVDPSPLRPGERVIEPDLSTAAPFLAAAAATGGQVVLREWPAHSAQPGRLLPELLAAFGCSTSMSDGRLVVRGPQRLAGVDLDLHDYGEAAPVLTALAVLADGPSRLRGIAHLRLQETDRLAALRDELGALGARIEVTDDGLAITPAPLHGGAVDPRDDHRLAMAYAVVGLVVPEVRIRNVATTGKTVPDFVARWTRLLEPA